MDMANYISSLLGSEKPISSVLNDLKDGKLKHSDVAAYFAAQYRPIVMRKIDAFQRGRLFEAQTCTWQRWLEGASRSDLQAWLDFKSDCWMAGRTDLEGAVCEFVYARVLSPDAGDRKRIAECSGPEHDNARSAWASRNSREGWTWRDDHAGA